MTVSFCKTQQKQQEGLGFGEGHVVGVDGLEGDSNVRVGIQINNESLSKKDESLYDYCCLPGDESIFRVVADLYD